MHTATFDSPTGPFTIVASDEAILASGWTNDPERLLQLIGPSLRPASVTAKRDLGPFTQAAHAYFDGEVTAIDDVPVTVAATPFLERAWQELRRIPAGQPETYGALAARCGSPAAVRAAGTACGRNPAALFVPCHRIVRTGGALGGFGYGLPVKRWLLDHESGVAAIAA
ncbi:MAG TPA: methylated-DNA--[protein]-cysteine S-methyltransferase [Conexibacter sp.]|nr:methylated-DNA--[protein]-cysteine S-methyltransferase [Conexibacter sp.]